jgi:hypothetical protein
MGWTRAKKTRDRLESSHAKILRIGLASMQPQNSLPPQTQATQSNRAARKSLRYLACGGVMSNKNDMLYLRYAVTGAERFGRGRAHDAGALP